MRVPGLARFYAATFLYSLAHALAVPLVPEHLDLTFGASLRFIGLVMGLYGLMQIVLRLPMGDMADRRGRKPSLVLAFAATAASSLLLAWGPTQMWAVPAVALFGFGGGVFWVAANSYLFDQAEAVGPDGAPARGVAKATSDYTIAMSLAFLVGPPLGHYVADHFGFRAAFLLISVTSAVGLLLVAMLHEPPVTKRPAPVGSPYRRAWRLLSHPALVLSAMGTFVYSTLFSTQQSFLQLHALAIGLSVTTIGLLLGGRQATSLLVRIGLPTLLTRMGPDRVMVGGIALFAGATVLVPFADSMPGLLALVAVAGVATGALIPANLMLVHEGAPREERGLANGIYGTMLGVGSALAPVLYGLAGDRFGLAWSFWSAGIVSAVLLAGIVAYRGRRMPAAGT